VSEYQDALETAKGLTSALKDMRDELARVNAYSRRTRHLVWITVASVILDVALSIAVTVFAIQVHQNAVTLSELHATNVSACQAGNQTRAKQDLIWHELAMLSKPAPGTTKAQLRKQEKAIRGFLVLVDKAEAPRNCAKAYRLP
jgi:hypothetical protein